MNVFIMMVSKQGACRGPLWLNAAFWPRNMPELHGLFPRLATTGRDNLYFSLAARLCSKSL
jgi:hypothetical protein